MDFNGDRTEEGFVAFLRERTSRVVNWDDLDEDNDDDDDHHDDDHHDHDHHEHEHKDDL